MAVQQGSTEAAAHCCVICYPHRSCCCPCLHAKAAPHSSSSCCCRCSSCPHSSPSINGQYPLQAENKMGEFEGLLRRLEDGGGDVEEACRQMQALILGLRIPQQVSCGGPRSATPCWTLGHLELGVACPSVLLLRMLPLSAARVGPGPAAPPPLLAAAAAGAAAGERRVQAGGHRHLPLLSQRGGPGRHVGWVPCPAVLCCALSKLRCSRSGVFNVKAWPACRVGALLCSAQFHHGSTVLLLLGGVWLR